MQESFEVETAMASSEDKIETGLRAIAQNITMVIFGLLPILFVPIAYAPFEYTKVIIIIFAVLLGIMFFSLSVLRAGSLRIQAPWALLAFIGVALTASISALLSGDMYTSFIGDSLGVQTALFMALLALVMAMPALIGQNKTTIIRMYILLTASAVLLGVFHILRIIFGAQFLSFGIFTGVTSSPLGSWNDLALFSGLAVLLSLVAFEQLPLTKWGRVLFASVVGFSLVLLAVVNFFAVWIILGLVSLLMLMYALTKERFAEKTMSIVTADTTSLFSISVSAVVFIFSLLFIIGGGTIGSIIANAVHISYIEVRPSLQSTIAIGRDVYKQNAFVGIGPNKFADAWRLYKDQSINQTVFWATDFNGGNGYVTTQFVTNGFLSVLAWLLFFVLFLLAGFRMLFRPLHIDRFWYFIGTSSFVAATYLWGITFFYNPGAVTLLLAALFTGVMFVAYGVLGQLRTFTLSISTNKRATIVLVGMVMLVIICTATVMYYAGRNYSAVYTFSRAVNSPNQTFTLSQREQDISAAYALNPNDTYAQQLALYQIAKMNALVGVQSPTDAQKKEFQSDAASGINAGLLSVKTNPTNPADWSTLGGVYSILAAAGVNGAKDKATQAFENARKYDPQNPVYLLLEAQLASRTGDATSSRTYANAAVQLKPDYTDALLFLSQLDIAEGKVTDAIAKTQSVITLDPQNPARYYQLGVLEYANKKFDDAITALNQAISLDTKYANARYFLALSYLQKNDTKDALDQLHQVLDLNPGNSDVTSLIAQVEKGNPISASSTSAQVQDPTTVSQNVGGVTTTKSPDTPLVTAVNTVSTTGTSTKNKPKP